MTGIIWNGGKQLKMTKMAGTNLNSWKWLEWLEMDGNFFQMGQAQPGLLV